MLKADILTLYRLLLKHHYTCDAAKTAVARHYHFKVKDSLTLKEFATKVSEVVKSDS